MNTLRSICRTYPAHTPISSEVFPLIFSRKFPISKGRNMMFPSLKSCPIAGTQTAFLLFLVHKNPNVRIKIHPSGFSNTPPNCRTSSVGKTPIHMPVENSTDEEEKLYPPGDTPRREKRMPLRNRECRPEGIKRTIIYRTNPYITPE